MTASSLFALDSKSGHSKIYDELCDIVDRVSYSGVLNAEDATDEYPDAVDVEFEVTSEDSAPYSVMVYIYGKEENDEESQLSYSVHDEYNNNLKDYISAVQGAPLGYQKGYKISELSQMWDDIEKDIQTLVSNADTDESKQKKAKKHTCSMQKKKESFAKKQEANSEEYITEWQADIIKGLEKVKDKYGLVIEYNGPFSDEWKEYPTYTVFVRKGGKKEDVGTVGTDYVHAFVDYANPGMNVSRPHKAKDYSAEEAIQVILNSAKMCLGKKGESKKSEGVYGTIRVDSEDIAIKVQESNVYPSSSGRSLTVEVPKVEAWFSTISEFSDCIDGLAESCNGYPDISRDGSDILVQINAPKEDESDDYEVIVELRCSTEITRTSLEGVVDLLNHD